MRRSSIIPRAVDRCTVLIMILCAALLGVSHAAEPARPVVDDTPAAPQDGSAAATAAAPTTSIVPGYRRAGRVAVLPVTGPIDRITLTSLERRMKSAMEDGADAIVIELDTPGGEMEATLDICDLLKDSTDSPANTVAWINDRAFSAGTIIALACREIVVAPFSRLGDAAPIMLTRGGSIQQMEPAERAKREAPLLNEVVDSARRHHYDENLVTAFISVQVKLWLIENTVTGEMIFINEQEYKSLFKSDPPDEMTSVGAAPRHAPRVLPRQSSIAERSPSTDPAAYAGDVEFNVAAPPWQELPSADEIDNWTYVGQVVSDDRLLTIDSGDAIFFGLAQQVVATDADMRAFFGASTLVRYDEVWSEGLVRFLISWPVRLVLIVVFLLAMFIEIAAPGVGVFGVTAAGALLLLVGAPALAGMAQWWDILLIFLGIALVLAELFIIPGFGVAGLAGAACLLIGMVGTFVSGDIGSVTAQDDIIKGLLTTFTGVFAAGIGMWICSRWFHTLPVFRRLMLTTELSRMTGPDAGLGPAGLIESMSTPQRALDEGDIGLAQTSLRPAGRGLFNNRIVDVQSTGSFIEKGTQIRVISVGRYVIEVEADEDALNP
jgi:membrane-bound serine protease (ClpP class)